MARQIPSLARVSLSDEALNPAMGLSCRSPKMHDIESTTIFATELSKAT